MLGSLQICMGLNAARPHRDHFVVGHQRFVEASCGESVLGHQRHLHRRHSLEVFKRGAWANRRDLMHKQ